MAFENHNRIGLLERASRIALKHGVVYSARERTFLGEADRVAKATAALEKWMARESAKVRWAKHDI